MKTISRRTFNSTLGKGIGATALLGSSAFIVANAASQKKKKLGIALVGLGSYSTYQLAPALLDTKHCYLAGIVTGTPEKEGTWASKYGIPKANIYNYQNFDTIRDNPRHRCGIRGPAQ